MRGTLEAIVMRAWSHRGLFSILMWPLSQLVQFIHNGRSALVALGDKKPTRLAVPVIVVGNIFVGGTGKTPLVIYLVQQLQQAGWCPGVISRGYGAQVHQVREVFPNSLASELGDEPVLIAQKTRCPVMVGRHRVDTAQALCAQYPQVNILISDDGLQHHALARDVEIMMFDQRGIGNGWCIPAGPLREPAHRRRDFTVLNAPLGVQVTGLHENEQDEQPIYHMQLIAADMWQLAAPDCLRSVSSLQGERIFACAGIGHPQRFFAMLQAQGVHFISQALADHHQFTAHSFQKIDADIILITEKDAVKCQQITELRQDQRIWVVPVVAKLDSPLIANIVKKILEKKNGCTPA